MSDLEQVALAVYFANCQGIKSDPLPMLRKILALRSALQPDDLDTLADAVAYFNGMDSAAGRNMAGAIGRAMGLALGGDSARLDWLLENHANVETDGAGNWRVVLEWTCPETYYPYAKARREAIDKAREAE